MSSTGCISSPPSREIVLLWLFSRHLWLIPEAMSIIAAFSFAMWQTLKGIGTVSILHKGDGGWILNALHQMWQYHCSTALFYLCPFFFFFFFGRGGGGVDVSEIKATRGNENTNRDERCSKSWPKTIVHGFEMISLPGFTIRHRYISDVLHCLPRTHTVILVYPHVCSPKSPPRPHAGCCKNYTVGVVGACAPVPLDMHPHHAYPYFSGALRWKSISFAKQSGRLPQHRGVMESDGWPPYREPWDKA